MKDIKTPDYFERYNFYSKENACIEIQHNTEYSYNEAVDFVRSLGYAIKDGDMWYDPMFKEWRGYINIVLEN